MKIVIDRIEDNNIAVCELESGKMINLPLEILPQDIKEGYILNLDVTINVEETEKAKELAEEILNDLF